MPAHTKPRGLVGGDDTIELLYNGVPGGAGWAGPARAAEIGDRIARALKVVECTGDRV